MFAKALKAAFRKKPLSRLRRRMSAYQRAPGSVMMDYPGCRSRTAEISAESRCIALSRQARISDELV